MERWKCFYMPDRTEHGRIKCMPGREVSELHEKRSAVVWQEFLRSAGSCGGVCCERIWPCL